jgi:hypothetical protein
MEPKIVLTEPAAQADREVILRGLVGLNEQRRRSCVGVFLVTFEFQARGFCEKLGHAVFGELPDHPIDTRHFFMQKSLR